MRPRGKETGGRVKDCHTGGGRKKNLSQLFMTLAGAHHRACKLVVQFGAPSPRSSPVEVGCERAPLYTYDFLNNAEHSGSDSDKCWGCCSSVGRCEQEGTRYQENNMPQPPAHPTSTSFLPRKRPHPSCRFEVPWKTYLKSTKRCVPDLTTGSHIYLPLGGIGVGISQNLPKHPCVRRRKCHDSESLSVSVPCDTH